MSAVFTCYIFEGRLVGTAAGKFFDLHALTGGGGGKHGPISPDWNVINNPYATSLKTKSSPVHTHGGPLPPGSYDIAKPSKHPHLGLSSQLISRHPSQMFGRSGFFIHNRGKHGSDGCIVPMERFDELMQALEAENGGFLSVQESQMGRFANIVGFRA
jgi:hypothetical protein